MSGPTPGPWRYTRGAILAGAGFVIADVRVQAKQTIPNASLIAAAPEMLRVLQFVATDPCFKVLGSVTHDEVHAAIRSAVGDREGDASSSEGA